MMNKLYKIVGLISSVLTGVFAVLAITHTSVVLGFIAGSCAWVCLYAFAMIIANQTDKNTGDIAVLMYRSEVYDRPTRRS